MNKRACAVLGMATLLATLGACAAPPPAVEPALFARFDPGDGALPRPLDVPWPSDVYRDADGTIADGLSDWTNAALGRALVSFESIGTLDGFGRTSAALFVLDGEASLDATSLPLAAACGAAGSPVAIVDLEATSTADARVPCVALWDPGARTLAIVPDRVLLPGHRYAAVITTELAADDGSALATAEAWRRVLDLAPAARATAVDRLYGEAADTISSLASIDRSSIAAIAPFTTQTTLPRALALHARALEEPEPSLVTDARVRVVRFGLVAHPGWDASLADALGAPLLDETGGHLGGWHGDRIEPPPGIAHDAIGALMSAALESPRFTRAYANTGTIDDGTIAFDAAAVPLIADARALVPVTIVLPAAPAPATGYPVLIVQHGAGQSRIIVTAFANELARAGIATIAIDAPFHGMRGVGAVDLTSPGLGPYDGPDGAPDASTPFTTLVPFLGHMRNALAFRDNLLQSMIDLAQLRRLIASASLDLSMLADAYGGTAPRLDGSRIAYVGTSMGGLLGTMLAAVEPRSAIDPFVLDVAPGSLFGRALPDSPWGQDQFAVLGASIGLPRDLLATGAHPYAHLAQVLLDGADAATFAADAVRGPDDLGHAIWALSALQDEATPRKLDDLFVRALGATQLTPTLRVIEGLPQASAPLRADAAGRLVAYFEVAPGSHAHLYARWYTARYALPWPRVDGGPRLVEIERPFPVRQSCIAAQRAIARFMESTWSGAPEIVLEGTPLSLSVTDDADDDGFCDDEESDADALDPAAHPSGTGACARDVGFPAE